MQTEKQRGDQLDFRGKKRSDTWTVNHDPSETIQSHAKQADITEILKKYKQGLTVEGLDNAEAIYMDISEFTDYADAMRHAALAEQTFMQLPSKVREIFHHNVAEWLDTAHDKEKRDALVEAGIIEVAGIPEKIAVREGGVEGAAEVAAAAAAALEAEGAE